MAGNESTNSSELSINYANTEPNQLNYNIKLIIKKGNANISVNKKGINIDLRSITSKNVDRSIQTDDIQNFRRDTADIISDTNSADTDVLEISSNCEKQKDLSVIMKYSEETVSETFELNKCEKTKSVSEVQLVEDDSNIFDLGPTEECLIGSKQIRSKISNDTGNIIKDTNSADTDAMDICFNSEKRKDLSVIMECSEEDISETNELNKCDETKSVLVPNEAQLEEDDLNMVDLGPTEECYVQPLTPSRAPKRSPSPALEYKDEKGPPKKKFKTALSQDMGSEVTQPNKPVQKEQYVPAPDTQARIDTTLTPDICRDLAASEDMLPGDNAPEPIVCTPEESNSWEDLEETPQKNISGLKLMNRSKTGAVNITSKSPTNTDTQARRDFCVAWSGLNVREIKNIQRLCRKRGWKFVTNYVNEITHLIVVTDEENKTQRTVKYVRALAAGKWIISYNWIEMCLKNKDVLKEEPFEVLDMSGYSGPKRARTSQRDLFKGIVFYCMPPYGVLNAESLTGMLEASGGKVVRDIKQVKATSAGPPALLLAEPEQAEQAKFSELAVNDSVVPVNFEWVVNCLGSYSLSPIDDLLLCPKSMVADAISHWPVTLVLP